MLKVALCPAGPGLCTMLHIPLPGIWYKSAQRTVEQRARGFCFFLQLEGAQFPPPAAARARTQWPFSPPTLKKKFSPHDGEGSSTGAPVRRAGARRRARTLEGSTDSPHRPRQGPPTSGGGGRRGLAVTRGVRLFRPCRARAGAGRPLVQAGRPGGARLGAPVVRQDCRRDCRPSDSPVAHAARRPRGTGWKGCGVEGVRVGQGHGACGMGQRVPA